MSSSTFQSMLLSKPRVENFHGSRIKSRGFIVSSRFSCVKFNASALSNLKVKSFMCCRAKVQNFVKSTTTCSSTSKIANFGEADGNYFEKVLIDRILKGVKWLKIPAVLVLLLTMTMSGRRGDSALAASSGVIGDHRSISSSSYESSALNTQHESSSPVLDFLVTILLLSVLVYIMYRLCEDYDKSKWDQTTIFKIEVGLRFPTSYNFEDEDEDYFAKIIKIFKLITSYSMFTYALTETFGVLCGKYMPFIDKSDLSVKVYNSREQAAAYYLKLAKKEQTKYDFIYAARIHDCEKTNTHRRILFKNKEWTYIVVTILVATKGKELRGFPNNISHTSSKIEAVNIFWTPLIENYGLTYMEVRASYPELYK